MPRREPIEFDGEKVLEVTKALEGMIEWTTPVHHALFWTLSGLPSYRQEDEAK